MSESELKYCRVCVNFEIKEFYVEKSKIPFRVMRYCKKHNVELFVPYVFCDEYKIKRSKVTDKIINGFIEGKKKMNKWQEDLKKAGYI